MKTILSIAIIAFSFFAFEAHACRCAASGLDVQAFVAQKLKSSGYVGLVTINERSELSDHFTFKFEIKESFKGKLKSLKTSRNSCGVFAEPGTDLLIFTGPRKNDSGISEHYISACGIAIHPHSKENVLRELRAQSKSKSEPNI